MLETNKYKIGEKMADATNNSGENVSNENTDNVDEVNNDNATDNQNEDTNSNNSNDNNENSEEKLFTQKEFEEKLKNRLDRETEKYSKLEKDFNGFKESTGDIESLKKNLEELSLEKEELVNNSNKLSSDFLKYKVAFEKGLSSDGLGLLSGKDEEELVENAERIARLSGTRQSLPPKNYKEANATSDSNEYYSELLKQSGI